MANKIMIFKVLTVLTSVFAILALVIFFFLGNHLNPIYFLGVVISIPLAIGAVRLSALQEQYKSIALARAQWGKPVARKRDFEEIAGYFRFAGAGLGKVAIDDQSCGDLDLHDMFSQLDRTLTGPGESVLYWMLRTPCTGQSAHELKRREQIISLLQKQQPLREKLQMSLAKMPRPQSSLLPNLLWRELPAKPRRLFAFTLLALAALLALPLPFLFNPRYIFIITILFGINTAIHYKTRSRISHQMNALAELVNLLKVGQGLAKASLPGLEHEQQLIEATLGSAPRILRKTWGLLIEQSKNSDLYFIYEYIRILFLMDIRSFYGVLEEIHKYREELQTLYRLIGSLDALLAVASFRQNLDYTEPEFLDSGKYFKATDIRHPLLSNPVPNSLEIAGKGILITGSNMAGKSTFLRTLGLNVVLAQSINTCLARSYRASYLLPATSINKLDNIASSKSLYYAEAERLRNILNPSYSTVPGLCLIDELLSGTNYVERVAASSAILSYLKEKNVLVVVATHDLDLAEELQEAYTCYHFSDKIEGKSLQFDYTLKPGITTTRNAIALLEHMGYPGEIIKQANANLT